MKRNTISTSRRHCRSCLKRCLLMGNRSARHRQELEEPPKPNKHTPAYLPIKSVGDGTVHAVNTGAPTEKYRTQQAYFFKPDFEKLDTIADAVPDPKRPLPPAVAPSTLLYVSSHKKKPDKFLFVVPRSKAAEMMFSEASQDRAKLSGPTCAICSTRGSSIMESKCKHYACRTCWEEWLSTHTKCPSCSELVVVQELVLVSPANGGPMAGVPPQPEADKANKDGKDEVASMTDAPLSAVNQTSGQSPTG